MHLKKSSTSRSGVNLTFISSFSFNPHKNMPCWKAICTNILIKPFATAISSCQSQLLRPFRQFVFPSLHERSEKLRSKHHHVTSISHYHMIILHTCRCRERALCGYNSKYVARESFFELAPCNFFTSSVILLPTHHFNVLDYHERLKS